MALTPSEVIMGRGLLGDDVLPPREGRRIAVVLTQPGALPHAARVADALGCETRKVLELPDGDAAKNLDVAARTYSDLNRLGLTRHDTIVAVGGGAVTDLAGFVAATYLRGIEAVYCPTTLLGAVDAAIGGKTGVNVDGKNLVGAFWHPSRIVIDVEVLEGLPSHLRRQGLAEALKAGMIGDAALVDLLEHDGLEADLADVVRRAVDVKIGVVSDDFRETGGRAVLNYGHTIGHGIEIAAGISHGEAVAVGMVAAAAVSEVVAGFDAAARQRGIIERLGLPVNAHFDRGQVLDLVQLDKKRDATGVRMVLLESIEHPIVRTVTSHELAIGLDAVAR